MLKKLIYVLYALWVALAIVLKIVFGASWWVALSWLWLPLSILLSLSLIVYSFIGIGNRLRIKEANKIPDACDICLHKKTASLTGNDCLGVQMGEKPNSLCGYYKRHLGK